MTRLAVGDQRGLHRSLYRQQGEGTRRRARDHPSRRPARTRAENEPGRRGPGRAGSVRCDRRQPPPDRRDRRAAPEALPARRAQRRRLRRAGSRGARRGRHRRLQRARLRHHRSLRFRHRHDARFRPRDARLRCGAARGSEDRVDARAQRRLAPAARGDLRADRHGTHRHGLGPARPRVRHERRLLRSLPQERDRARARLHRARRRCTSCWAWRTSSAYTPSSRARTAA